MSQASTPVASIAALLVLLGSSGSFAQENPADRKVDLTAPVPKRPGPEPLVDVPLGPMLTTHPIPSRSVGPNWMQADATVLPRDRAGIWVLEFAFKPVRFIEIEVPGKGRKKVHYMEYRVVNRTGKPVMFVPQFTLVTDTGKKYEDVAIAKAVEMVQAREEPTKVKGSVLGAVTVCGYVPPSTKDGVDDAVYGVAVWDNVDQKADAFKVYVRGLSDGYQVVQPPDDAKPYTRYKALRVDYVRPGDERNPHEREIRLADPAFEWVYYP